MPITVGQQHLKQLLYTTIPCMSQDTVLHIGMYRPLFVSPHLSSCMHSFYRLTGSIPGRYMWDLYWTDAPGQFFLWELWFGHVNIIPPTHHTQITSVNHWQYVSVVNKVLATWMRVPLQGYLNWIIKNCVSCPIFLKKQISFFLKYVNCRNWWFPYYSNRAFSLIIWIVRVPGTLLIHFLKSRKDESKHKIIELSLFKGSAISYGIWNVQNLKKWIISIYIYYFIKKCYFLHTLGSSHYFSSMKYVLCAL